MIISQTPVRISFLGGGTDYPAYYKEHGGATLAVTINKYTVITVHHLTQFADHSINIHYSKIEAVRGIDEIQHPSARECLRYLGIDGGVEIHYVSSLPARTGLGSSSSATVGLLNALHGFKGELVSRDRLAAEAVHVEQNMIRERVGSQDQYSCAMGGLQHLQFHKDGTIRSDPVPLPSPRLTALQDHLMLLYTSVQRSAHDVLDEQIKKTESGSVQKELTGLHDLVRAGLDVLSGNHDLRQFGELLHAGWLLKRQLSSKISNPWIDELYDRARKAGAIGGKLLGAGSGGFLLLFVEPAHRHRVRQELAELRETSFAFENTGSQLVFYRP